MRLRVVRCEKCGGSVQLRAGASTAQCAQCGTTATREKALQAEQRHARSFPNPTPLRLGMKGRFKDQEYELIGRLVQSTVEEGTTYRWEEFELIAPDGDALFLELDEGQWKLMETFVPTQPLGPQQAAALSKGSFISLDSSRASVTDRGKADVCHVEGELTFAAKVGDQRQYLDARYLNRFYTVEWDEDEIEYYRGHGLSPREVFVAFGLKEQLSALDALAKKRLSQRLFAGVCLWLSLLAFIGWGVALASGTVVQRASVPITSVNSEQGVRSLPITLDPRRHVHRLVIQGSMREASAWVAGVLETADGTELIGAQRDFWDESGSDSDGYWHESDLRAQTDFVVRRPGPYAVRLYVERDSPTGSYGDAGYELRGGVLYPGYFLTYGIVTLILAVLFFFLGAQETLKKMSESSD